MEGSFLYTVFGIFALIIPLMSCGTHQNPTTNQLKMKELLLKDAEFHEIYYPDQTNEIVYQLTFKYERKLRHAVFYYKQYSGIINGNDLNEKCTVTLTKKSRELPRSIYPLLTQGYIVVQFSWLGLETYQVIKEFKKLEPTARN
jgi:hypothetical protein